MKKSKTEAIKENQENNKTTVYIEPDIMTKLKSVKAARQAKNPRVNITLRALINEFLEQALKNIK